MGKKRQKKRGLSPSDKPLLYFVFYLINSLRMELIMSRMMDTYSSLTWLTMQ